MDERTESRVKDWDSRSFPGGYDALRELADANFSGAVVSHGGTWLFMLNGRVVGVFGGSIEHFEDGGGTTYKAPHPSLPLLFAMLEYGGEQQAKYYTNDTPVSEADQQLKDLNFTGYIELSENVLSGDYYSVYYGGRSMSCAFVGSAERLITDDEAFSQADDEVGIYEVRAVDLDVVDIPDPEPEPEPESEPEPTGGGAAVAGGAAATQEQEAQQAAEPPAEQATEAAAEPAAESTAEPAPEPAAKAEPATEAAAEPAAESTAEPATEATAEHATRASASRTDASAATEPQAEPEPATRREPEATPDPEREPEPQTEPSPEPQAERAARAEGASTSEPEPQPDSTARTETPARTESATSTETDARTTTETDPRSESTASTEAPARSETPGSADAAGAARGREEPGTESSGEMSQPEPTTSVEPTPKSAFETTTRIPSLDPDRTGTDADGGESAAATASTDRTAGSRSSSASGSTHSDVPTGEAAADAALEATADRRSPEEKTGGAVRSADTDDDTGAAVDAAVESAAASGELQAELDRREERIETLEAQLADLRVQRDGLRDERDDLRDERDELQAEIEELQTEISRLRERLNEGTEGKRRMSPEEALTGTNLFVRYGSKGEGTLEKAHGGNADRDDVNGNLRLEHHTQFDASAVAVDGEDFETFLDSTIQKRFVDWVVRDLLFEVRETSNVKNLKDLYDALPQVDRAELYGDVSVEYTKDGEQYREQRQFDVVLRDRMGHPLLVADLNDSRNPATEEMMEGVIENASDVKESNDTLASAMLVTASFFEPGALEAANEAAGGGLFGGSSKSSFVKLSRKRGYHLLLVETRSGEFHVNVPEL